MLVPRPEWEGVDSERLIAVLGAAHAQAILEGLDRPMSAREISHACNVPLSSTYRRLKALADADLLETQIAIDPDEGKHVTQYARAFDTIEMTMTDEGIAVQLIR